MIKSHLIEFLFFGFVEFDPDQCALPAAVHMLLGMGMICAVGAGSFVYVSLIGMTECV